MSNFPQLHGQYLRLHRLDELLYPLRGGNQDKYATSHPEYTGEARYRRNKA